jgi:hypothetical protein
MMTQEECRGGRLTAPGFPRGRVCRSGDLACRGAAGILDEGEQSRDRAKNRQTAQEVDLQVFPARMVRTPAMRSAEIVTLQFYGTILREISRRARLEKSIRDPFSL